MFVSSELPILDGRIYHLQLAPEEIAGDIIIVGDPDRVPLIAEAHLESVEVDRAHRGLRSITGHTRSGQRISVITSGMGTPSLEIVVNEIVALHEIDFQTRERKAHLPVINIIRVGTSGGLRSATPLGTSINSIFAVGLDNSGFFYDVADDPELTRLEERVRTTLEGGIPAVARFKRRIDPYAARAHPHVAAALEQAARSLNVPLCPGITISNSGFFANQGRDITRISPTISRLPELLSGLTSPVEGVEFENMEMEASFLFHFMHGCGHRAGAICPVIANRSLGTFLDDPVRAVTQAVAVAIEALRILRA